MTATIATAHDAPQSPVSAASRVMVIYPGHRHSTRDVADTVVAGLRAAGAEVCPFHYHEFIESLLPLEETWKAAGMPERDAVQTLLLRAFDAAFPRFMAFRPHLALFVTGYVAPEAGVHLMNVYCPTAVILTESPYQWETERRVVCGFNYAFTNERKAVAPFIEVRRAAGHPHPERVGYLPHAFNPAVHHPREPEPGYASDVVFVSSPFPERQALFRGVDWSGIDLKTFGLWVTPGDVDELYGAGGFISNDEAHRWYAGTKIAVNHHRKIRYFGSDQEIAPGEAESLNPRVYELAAAGVFQVCDDSRAELAEVFGDSVPTYRDGDSADFERVIRYYLAHPDERARRASAAYAIVQRHSGRERMRGVLRAVGLHTGIDGAGPDDRDDVRSDDLIGG